MAGLTYSSSPRKRKTKLGSGARFKELKGKLAKKGAKSPGPLAAWIGRKKYGKAKFQKLAVGGKKRRVIMDGQQPHNMFYGKQYGQQRPFGQLGNLQGAMGKLARKGV